MYSYNMLMRPKSPTSLQSHLIRLPTVSRRMLCRVTSSTNHDNEYNSGRERKDIYHSRLRVDNDYFWNTIRHPKMSLSLARNLARQTFFEVAGVRNVRTPGLGDPLALKKSIDPKKLSTILSIFRGQAHKESHDKQRQFFEDKDNLLSLLRRHIVKDITRIPAVLLTRMISNFIALDRNHPTNTTMLLHAISPFENHFAQNMKSDNLSLLDKDIALSNHKEPWLKSLDYIGIIAELYGDAVKCGKLKKHAAVADTSGTIGERATPLMMLLAATVRRHAGDMSIEGLSRVMVGISHFDVDDATKHVMAEVVLTEAQKHVKDEFHLTPPKYIVKLLRAFEAAGRRDHLFIYESANILAQKKLSFPDTADVALLLSSNGVQHKHFFASFTNNIVNQHITFGMPNGVKENPFDWISRMMVAYRLYDQTARSIAELCSTGQRNNVVNGLRYWSLRRMISAAKKSGLDAHVVVEAVDNNEDLDKSNIETSILSHIDSTPHTDEPRGPDSLTLTPDTILGFDGEALWKALCNRFMFAMDAGKWVVSMQHLTDVAMALSSVHITNPRYEKVLADRAVLCIGWGDYTTSQLALLTYHVVDVAYIIAQKARIAQSASDSPGNASQHEARLDADGEELFGSAAVASYMPKDLLNSVHELLNVVARTARKSSCIFSSSELSRIATAYSLILSPNTHASEMMFNIIGNQVLESDRNAFAKHDRRRIVAAFKRSGLEFPGWGNSNT